MADETVSLALIWQGINKFRAEAKAATSAIDRGFAKAKQKIAEANAKLKAHAAGLKKLPNLAMMAGAAYAASRFVKAAGEQQQAIHDVGVEIQMQGGNWEEFRGQVEELTASLQKKTIYGDEVSMRAMQKAMNTGANYKDVLRDLSLMQDVAAGTGRDLGTIGEYMGRAMMGQVEMIARYVPAIRDLSAEERTYTNVRRILIEQFQGKAIEQAKTEYGALMQLKNIFGDVMEMIGAVILTAIKPFIDLLSLILRGILALPSPIKVLITTIGLLAGAIKILGISFKTALGPWGLIIQGIVLALVLLYNAWTKNWFGIKDKTIAVVKTVAAYIEALWETIKILARNVPTALKNIWRTFVNYFGLIFEVSKELHKRLIGLLGGIGKALLGVLTLSPSKIKEGMKEALSAVKDGWKETVEKLAETSNKGMQEYDIEGLQEVWKKAGEKARKAFKEGLTKKTETEEEPETDEGEKKVRYRAEWMLGDAAEIDAYVAELEEKHKTHLDKKEETTEKSFERESQMLGDMESAYDNWFMSLTDKRMNAAQRAEALYQDVERAATRSALGELKAFLFKEKIVKGESKKTTLHLIGEYATRVAKAIASIAVEIAGAVAGAVRWLASKLGPFGFLAAPGLLASGIALLASLRKTFGFAEGGAIMGEKGPEVIAPVKSFVDYSGAIAREVARAVREAVGVEVGGGGAKIEHHHHWEGAHFYGTQTEMMKQFTQKLKEVELLDRKKILATT